MLCGGLGGLLSPTDPNGNIVDNAVESRNNMEDLASQTQSGTTKDSGSQQTPELNSWLDQYISTLSQIENLEANTPPPPEFPERTWSTIDEKYTTQGRLVSSDGVDATILKNDGKTITVKREILIATDRIYIDNSLSSLRTHKDASEKWQAELKDSQALLSELEDKISRANPPINLSDQKTEIATSLQTRYQEKVAAEAARMAEIEAAKELARKQQEEAERLESMRIAKENAQKQLDQFAEVLKQMDENGNLIAGVSISDLTATIKVKNLWHLQNYQIRYQSAQNVWEAWAAIARPKDVDHARIKIVDLNGNEVGGSRFLAGSLIWVNE